VRASTLQHQTCNASYTTPMHRALGYTLTAFQISQFYAFLPNFDEGSTPQIQIPAGGITGWSESFFLRLDFTVFGLFVLSHPLLSPCQEHGFLQACSCVRQSPGNIRKCALFPNSASVKAGGGIRGHAQGNPASCKQPCLSPNCHIHWASSSHAKQTGRR